MGKIVKVSLIYTKSGGGHISLAQATHQALQQHFPGRFSCTYFDPSPQITARAYKQLSSDLQRLWSFSYSATNTPQISSFLHDINTLTITDKLVAHFLEFQPDVVVSNYPFGTTEIRTALSKIHSPAPVVILFADPFTPHETWFSFKTADLYLCPTPKVAALAQARHISPARLTVTGWLTRTPFLPSPPPAVTARTRLGLSPDKFTIFIGGAGQGGGKIYDTCKAILQRPRLVSASQIIVNTGLNPRLTSQIIKLAQIVPSLFYPVPLAHNMRQLLSASDVVVGKAGPNLLFESIHTLRPFLATGCLPGQEDGNLDFIQSARVGWVQPDPDLAASLLEKLSTHPQLITQLTPHLKSVKRQHLHASRRVAHAIAALVS